MIDAKPVWEHRIVPHLGLWEMDVWRHVSPNRLLYRIQQRTDSHYALLKGNWPRKEGEPYDITWPLETTSIEEAQRQADEIITAHEANYVPPVKRGRRPEVWHGACDFCGRPAVGWGNICRGCDEELDRDQQRMDDEEAAEGGFRQHGAEFQL